MWVGGKRQAPATLPTERDLVAIVGGPQGRSAHVRKISPPPGLDPRTVQPATSRYTDWAIPVHLPPNVCPATASTGPRRLPLKSFPVHHSSITLVVDTTRVSDTDRILKLTSKTLLCCRQITAHALERKLADGSFLFERFKSVVHDETLTCVEILFVFCIW